MDVRGAVILGGAHGALALARRFGAYGVPVWCIGDDSPLPGLSRFVKKRVRWPGPKAQDAVQQLLALGQKHALNGFLLVPAGDGEVQMVSQNHQALSAFYRIVLPEWDRLQWLCEKPLLYEHAVDLAIDVPKTVRLTTLDDAARTQLSYPVVLKPHMGGGRDRFTKAKALRADDRSHFLKAFEFAAAETGAGNVVVQEMIGGGGERQFSYAGLWNEGRPLAEFTARRVRQYPIDFGYTSTFVEVVDEPRATAAAQKLLHSLDYSGLVEIEFKEDPRDGKLKLLDVNPRPWSWMSLCAGCGVDLGGMLWCLVAGVDFPAVQRRQASAWCYASRDMIGAGQMVIRGQLGAGAYFKARSGVRSWASFSRDDPLPGLLDLPLTVWRVVTRRLFTRPRDI